MYFVCSTMPSDCMDDIDLKNIQLQFPNTRTLSKDDSSVTEERVETGTGSVLVAVQGTRSKPAILTYHDLGLNCEYKIMISDRREMYCPILRGRPVSFTSPCLQTSPLSGWARLHTDKLNYVNFSMVTLSCIKILV
jgi:hypothetical protein